MANTATTSKAEAEVLPKRLPEQNIMVSSGMFVYRAVTGIKPPTQVEAAPGVVTRAPALWGGYAKLPAPEVAEPEPDDEEDELPESDEDKLLGATGWARFGGKRVPVEAIFYGDVLVWEFADEHPAYPKCPEGHALDLLTYGDNTAEWARCEACRRATK